MKAFVLGVVVTLVVLMAGAWIFVMLGMMPAWQDQKPGKLETWAATTSLNAAVSREAKTLRLSIQPTEPNLTAGATLYASHCQVCHGGPDAQPSPIAKGLSPDPPQLAKEGVEDDPESMTFAKIARGIRFTGMPAFRPSLSEEQMWQVVLFLKHMDSLPPATHAAWDAAKHRG